MGLMKKTVHKSCNLGFPTGRWEPLNGNDFEPCSCLSCLQRCINDGRKDLQGWLAAAGSRNLGPIDWECLLGAQERTRIESI